MSKRQMCVLVSVVLWGISAVITAPVAGAHATLTAGAPAAGTSLTALPQQAIATFDEPVEAAFASLTVTGPSGDVVSAGQVRVSGSQLSVALSSSRQLGSYTAEYRLMAADGHIVSGSWSFAMVAPQP